MADKIALIGSDTAALIEAVVELEGVLDHALTALVENQREHTAATILAALTTDRMVPDEGLGLDECDAWNIRYAVILTDALRAELAKGRP